MPVGYLAGAEDFLVEEVPLYEATGEGGHTFVFVEKRMLNTEDVARALARLGEVPARDVGFAGRKDRIGVTRQYFSVPGLEPERALAVEAPGFRVLTALRHPHKLRTGHLAGNRFAIRVRGVEAEAVARAQTARAALSEVGMPNRFGEQRFGREGANVARGRALLARGAAGRDRRRARFLVSALQAAVFNEVLRRRPLPIDRVERGDLARRTDSGGLFVVEDDEVDNDRAARFEISATGPIFGTRMEEPKGDAAQRERDVMTEFGVDPDALRVPKGLRLRGGRRPVRVQVSDLAVEPGPVDAGGLADVALRFGLPAGSYATVALEELLGFQPERGASAREDGDPETPSRGDGA